MWFLGVVALGVIGFFFLMFTTLLGRVLAPVHVPTAQRWDRNSQHSSCEAPDGQD